MSSSSSRLVPSIEVQPPLWRMNGLVDPAPVRFGDNTVLRLMSLLQLHTPPIEVQRSSQCRQKQKDHWFEPLQQPVQPSDPIRACCMGLANCVRNFGVLRACALCK